MQIQPYLFFNGRCEEAIAFYRQALGAEVEMMMRYNESPEPIPPGMLPPGFETKVMHATLRIGGAVMMVGDGMFADALEFKGITLSIEAPNAATAERMFAALAKGGTVRMPLAKTFWSPLFGMVNDHFGMRWMVTIPPQ